MTFWMNITVVWFLAVLISGNKAAEANINVMFENTTRTVEEVVLKRSLHELGRNMLNPFFGSRRNENSYKLNIERRNISRDMTEGCLTSPELLLDRLCWMVSYTSYGVHYSFGLGSDILINDMVTRNNKSDKCFDIRPVQADVKLCLRWINSSWSANEFSGCLEGEIDLGSTRPQHVLLHCLCVGTSPNGTDGSGTGSIPGENNTSSSTVAGDQTIFTPTAKYTTPLIESDTYSPSLNSPSLHRPGGTPIPSTEFSIAPGVLNMVPSPNPTFNHRRGDSIRIINQPKYPKIFIQRPPTGDVPYPNVFFPPDHELLLKCKWQKSCELPSMFTHN